MKTKIFLTLWLLMAAFAASASGWRVADVPNVQVADHTKHLSNPCGIISAPTAAHIDSLLLDLRRRTSAEVAVVVIDKIDSESDIDHFATELFDLWRPGKSDTDNGMLIVVSRDDRRAAIRTGYGLEGVIPDITAGRIIRKTMAPAYQRGDYDAGTLLAVEQVCTLLSDPEAAAEFASDEADNYGPTAGDMAWNFWLRISAGLGVAALILLIIMLIGSRKADRHDKYLLFARLKVGGAVLSVLTLGAVMPAFLIMLLMMRHWRNGRHVCPNCGHQMRKLDEVSDNAYLTPAQDTEERIGSVDYDVWVCDDCGESDIYPYVNEQSQWHECDTCHARTARLDRTRIVVKPTATHEGRGIKDYRCQNCGAVTQRPYTIAKTAPVVIVPGGGGGGGSFGGGSFGGGFGGGMTGGGGASGGW